MMNATQTSEARILVVDDIQDNLDLMVEVLEDGPWTVATALDAASALDQASVVDFDLFLLDVHMPDVDGFELCRRLRSIPETRTAPVLFVTAERTSTESVIEGLDTGGFDYITKPFEQPELLARIRVMLRLRKAEKELLVVQASLHDQNQNLSAMNDRLAEACQRMLEQRIELMRRSRQLERANSVKSEFLAKMSHELRTPLNSIIGFTDLMVSDKKEPAGERQAQRLERVGRNGRQLLALINDILDLSKIEADRMTLALAPVDVPAVARDCIELARPLVGEKPVALEAKIPERLRIWEGDEVRLRQILTNLLSNAVKFTDFGVVTLEVGETEDRLEISVSDTGIGIAPEHLSYVFEPFRQVDSSSARRAAGTGLGLSICRKLCSLMGGAIEARSEQGVGSTFVVEIPWRAKQQELDYSSITNDLHTSSSHQVLLCTADAGMADLTSTHLATQGITVRHVDMPDDIAKLIERERPNGVIIDARWPKAANAWHASASRGLNVWLTLWSEDHQVGHLLQLDELISMPNNLTDLGTAPLAAASSNQGALVFSSTQCAGEQIRNCLEELDREDIRTTKDLSETLDLLTDGRVADLFVDLAASGTDALELIRRTRQIPEWADVRIIGVLPSLGDEKESNNGMGAFTEFLRRHGVSTPTLLLDIAENLMAEQPAEPVGVLV